MKYYIAENGQPAGPFELKDLMQHGLSPNSQVWNEKMSGWTRASEVPELMTLMGLPTAAQPVQPVQPVQPQPSPYAPQQSAQPEQPQPEQSPYAPQQPESQTTNIPSEQTVQQGYGQQPSPYAQPQYEKPAEPQPTYNGQAGQQPQYPQPQYQQPQYQQPQYQQPQQFPQQQMPYGQQYVPNALPPKNWMTESVIFTVVSVLCCCNPFSLITGIIAIVNAGKVNGLFQRGDTLGASESAKQAKMWALITLGLLVLGIILCVVLVMVNPELKQAFMEGYENGYNPV